MKEINRTQWFEQARFGMFIHWGLYAIPARGEWVRRRERISNEAYQIYFDEFNPANYDPAKWARLCKQAGMKYAVLTAKHHDGFCLFDSALTDYKSTNTLCGRDLVREYVDAFRNEGIAVGLYYSLIDWHHPDYPAFGDRQHPMQDNVAFQGVHHQFDRYLDYMHGQVRELCSNYGKIDILWFDFSYDDMRGEKWRATELVRMVRELQPCVIMDNRLEVSGEGLGSIVTGNPSAYSGDFVSPEQLIPPNGILKENGEPVCWEACVTMNNNWGYCESDNEYKSPETCIRKLVECVSKNGNLILNVGPDAKGNIPVRSVAILKEIGEWMDKNSKSIYGCGSAAFEPMNGQRYTANGKHIYLHQMEAPIGPVAVKGIAEEQIKRVRLLSSGAELHIANSWATGNYPGYSFFSLGPEELSSYPLPDPRDTVIDIELK